MTPMQLWLTCATQKSNGRTYHMTEPTHVLRHPCFNTACHKLNIKKLIFILNPWKKWQRETETHNCFHHHQSCCRNAVGLHWEILLTRGSDIFVDIGKKHRCHYFHHTVTLSPSLYSTNTLKSHTDLSAELRRI